MLRFSFIYLPLLLLGVAIAGASLLFLSPGAASDGIDLTGEWEFTIAGDFSASCDLDIEQTGTSISGTFDCDDGTSGGFAGTITQEVSGASLDLDLTIVPLIGPTVSADAEGTVPADGNSFTGTWDAPAFVMSGTFDGTRLSGPPPTPSPSPSPSPTPNAKIHSVEFTQAIQEWQTIEELKSDLQADQSPPVPMIEGKPGTIRVYLTEVEDVTTVKVQASGSVSGTKNVTLLPGCTPEKRRKQEGSCDSVNFDFAGAPSGFWSVNIILKNDDNDVLEQHSFNLKSVEADTLALKTVKVCDTPGAGVFTPWQCSNPMRLATLAQYLRKVAPTDSVIVSNSGDVIYRNASGYANPKDWWKDVTLDIEDLFSAFDVLAGLAGQERYYFGMVRPEGPGGLLGRASGVPGRGGAAKEVSSTLGVDDSHLTTAHEVGHMLGVRHTNKGVPSGGFPACYATAPDNNTDWAYADNRLRSGSAPGTIEVGFDVATKMALDGSRVFELMGYCNPQWVSPRTYGQMLAALGGGSPSALPASQPTEGDYWLVSGEILEDAAVLRPLFTISTTGSAAAGTGDYSIEVRDEVGSVLFERFFTPIESSARPEPGEDSPPPAYIFSELIPVQAGAATLVVLDGSVAEIGSIQIDGALPDVTVSVDDGGASAQNSLFISWTIEDADSSDHTVWLDYSPNGGQDWTNLGMRHGGAGLTIDPEDLPGSGNAVVRVLASDGVNTGAAVSEPFSVAKKPPEAEILFPGDGDVFGFGDVVWFQGLAFDPDDGTLEDSVSWSSSIDGPLGTGTNLPLTDLSIGEHVVTLEVTDSDDNVVTDEITVVIGDADVDETVLPTPTPTPMGPTATPAPTATSTPTTTVTPTPTPTPGGELTQGDADCDGDVDAVDALKTLQYVAALAFSQEPGCPEIGSTLIAAAAPAGADPIFGDVDCDEDVDAVDALQILRFVAGLQVNQGAGCKPIGV